MKRIGIDLGTTNSCVYYLDESGNPVLVTDDRGNGIFPSAVWCAGKGKERVVGHKAKARMGNQPSPIIAVKRKMGTDQKVMLGGELGQPGRGLDRDSPALQETCRGGHEGYRRRRGGYGAGIF